MVESSGLPEGRGICVFLFERASPPDGEEKCKSSLFFGGGVEYFSLLSRILTHKMRIYRWRAHELSTVCISKLSLIVSFSSHAFID